MENNPHITPENNNSSIPVTEPVNEQEASAQSNPTESPLTDNVPVDDSFWSGEFKPEGEKPRGNANSLPPQNGQASEMPFNARGEGFVPPPQGTVPPMQGTVPPAQGNAPYQVYHSSFENAGPQYHYGYNHKVVDPRYI